MKSKSAEKIKLTSYDDLFGSSEVTAGEKVVSVPIRLFHTFKDHPFRVLDDEKMRHDRRSAMITDEFVVEKPSFVEIKLTGDNIILYDYLLEQRFVLSPIAYEMFLEFDGIKSIRDIAIIIAQEYGEVLENIIHDVTDLVVSLARVNIILVKGTFKYKLIKRYYKMIFYKRGNAM